jgi:hypothetical protein
MLASVISLRLDVQGHKWRMIGVYIYQIIIFPGHILSDTLRVLRQSGLNMHTLHGLHSTVEMILRRVFEQSRLPKTGCWVPRPVRSNVQEPIKQSTVVIETRFTRKAFKGARLPGVSLFFGELVRYGTDWDSRTCSSTRVIKEDAKFTKFLHSFPSRTLRNRIGSFYT